VKRFGRTANVWTIGLIGLIGVIGVIAAWGGAALAATGTTDPASPAAAPTIIVLGAPTGSSIAPGATFHVLGTGWDPNSLVELQVCGHRGDGGATNCSAATAVVATTAANGGFDARLSVVLPPTPCPCVVRASTQGGGPVVATAGVTIPGAPGTPTVPDGGNTPPRAGPGKLDVENVRLAGSDSMSTLLGGRATRTLEFDLVNSGSVAVTGASVVFTAGSAGHLVGAVPTLKLGPFAVGERRSFLVPIRFGALGFGAQVVRGELRGTAVGVTFTATTTTHPWLLIAIGAVVLIVLIVRIARRMSHRRRERALVPGAVDPLEPDVADDVLICVVDMMDPPSPSAPYELRQRTEVLRGVAAVQRLVMAFLAITPSQGTPVAINSITLLADVSAPAGGSTDVETRIEAARLAAEQLCSWVEAAAAASNHPAAAGTVWRRHGGVAGEVSSAPLVQLGMVPLGVLARADRPGSGLQG
jgi:hypothetical protein